MAFPDQRVAELEAELREVRAAFEEYITNSKELEAGLDAELTQLHKKLESSTAANEVLGNQLEMMEPMLGDLERSLDSNKAKLKAESRRRQELESRCQEMEAENMALREENSALREECETLGDQLGHKADHFDRAAKTQSKVPTHDSPSGGTSAGDTETRTGTSTVDDSYGEILDELEGVTEQLIDTQQKLWKAEDNCRESQSRVAVLERALKSLKRLDKDLDTESKKSLLDDTEDEESNASDPLNDAEARHSQELERIHSELNKAKRDRDAAEIQTKYAQQEARVAKANTKNVNLRAQLAEIDELKAKNAVLMEETNCLREILEGRNGRDPDDRHTNKTTKEIACLHAKLKTVIKENVSLRQQIERLQRGQTSPRSVEVLELKKKVAKLEYSLEKADEQNMSSIHDSEFEWFVKLEKLRKDLDEQKAEELAQLQRDIRTDADAAVQSLQEQIERLADDNRDLQEVIDHLESEVRRCQKENSTFADKARVVEENLKESRDEITSLKKKGASLTTDLDRAERHLGKSQEEAKEARQQYADVCVELEMARQILDEAGLDHERIARDDERDLKCQIHSLSNELERVRNDYVELENEFLESQQRFCDSQEEASRKTADEVDYLTGKIAEMEAALELARADYSDMSVKLENARKESHSSLQQGKKQGRESAMRVANSQYTSEVNKVPSDDEIEDEDLKKKLGDLVAQLEKVNAELRACKADLEKMMIENEKLKDDVARFEESGVRGVEVLDKFFNGEGTTDVRNGLDPEPLLDTNEPTRPPPNAPVSESLFKIPFSSWFSRDPPTTEKVESLEDSPRGFEEPIHDAGNLQSQLRLLTRENEFLKEKIVSLECANHDVIKSASESDPTEPNEIRQVIKDLEQALQRNEKNADELERLSQKLATTERKLASTQMVLEETNDENDDLRAEVRELKIAVSEARQKLQETMAAEQRVEFADLRDRLKALTDEKSALQHKLDDTNIALSTTQYELENHRQEVRAKETVLGKSEREIAILKQELDLMSRSLQDIKVAYDDVLRQLRRGREADGGDAIVELSAENRSLQRVVQELQQALARSSQHKHAVAETDSLHEVLQSQDEQNMMLADEVSRLSEALELSRCEYNAVVEELEAVCDLFEEAREEAERNGKAAAIIEIRTAMKGSRENERHAIREQAKKIFEENGNLQRKLAEVEFALTQARQFQKRYEEMAAADAEVQILREALESGEEEMKSLRERELSLDLALKEAKMELKNTREELEMIRVASDETKQAVEKSARALAVQEFRSMGNSSELTDVREKLREMLEYAENDLRNTSSIDLESDQRNEGLKMKIELLDMSMSLEKIMRENAVIEEELEHVKLSAEGARKEGEKEGRMRAMKDLRLEMDGHRHREIKEFKEKYNSLVSENADLSRKLRANEIQLSLAVTLKEQMREEVARMEEELKGVTMEATKLQQDALELTIELSAARDEHQSSDASSANDEIRNKLSTITLENTKLQSKLRNTEAMLERTRQSDEKNKFEIKSLSSSLKESQRKIETLKRISSELKTDLHTMKLANDTLLSEKVELQTQLRQADSSTSPGKMVTLHEVGEFEKAFQISKEENAKLRSQTAQLKETLEVSTKELDKLRGQFDRVYNDAASRDTVEAARLREQLKKLVAEKAALQKQVDESKVNLSLQKYTQDRNLEELKVYQDKLLSTHNASNARCFDQSKAEEEIARMKEDVKATMRVLRQTSHMLDLVDGLDSDSFVAQDTLVGRAEDIKGRVSEVTALLEKAKDDSNKVNEQLFRLTNEFRGQERKLASSETALERVRQTQLRDKMELELSEVKYAEARKEASGYKSEIYRLRSALENAEKDHSSLRGQLEQMNFRVQQMCVEAEAKGKAAATEALRAGIGNDSATARKELMAQFKKLYDENVSLQSQLDRQKVVIENLERDARETSANSASLLSANKRLTQELDSLREDLDQAKAHRTKVVRELSAVKERLFIMSTEKKSNEIKPECDSPGESLVSMQPPANDKADVHLFQDHFSHLVQANPGTSYKSEKTKFVVSSIEMPAGKPRNNTDTRKMQLRELQRQVQLAIEESSQRTEEIDYGSRAIGGRAQMDEHKLGRRGRSASPAKDNRIHVEPSALFSANYLYSTKPSFHTDNAVVVDEQHDVEAADEDSSIRSFGDQANSESREDSHAAPVSREMAARSQPLPRPIPVKESKNLTSRALEAIAKSKKNKYKYRDELAGKNRDEIPTSPDTDEHRGRE